MKILLVGGTFDSSDFGKPSKIVKEISEELKILSYFTWDVSLLNGGNISTLYDAFGCQICKHDVIIWMPNISNDVEDKMIDRIKQNNPTTILVQSKRVVEKEYSNEDIIKRLLRSHSALGIKVGLDLDSRYDFTLLDPLGNLYAQTNSVKSLASALFFRLKELTEFTRYKSIRLGNRKNFNVDEDFICCVKEVATKFTPLVSGASTERFLGNASTRVEPTRCSYGFPAERLTKDKIAVSKRNVNKEMLTKNQFVLVTSSTGVGVQYYGDDKPSVDAPIQIELFNYYNYVRFMIHGHVYIEGAPMTEHKIPCGALEEVADIIRLYPNSTSTNFSVNLKGHGCIMLADNVNYFRQQKFVARPFPEGGL